MQRLFTMMPPDQFKMLAVLNSDKPSLGEFITRQNGYTMPVLDDSNNHVGARYGLAGISGNFWHTAQGDPGKNRRHFDKMYQGA
jgi:hypothetical protein